jgi:hypothetical protein
MDCGANRLGANQHFLSRFLLPRFPSVVSVFIFPALRFPFRRFRSAANQLSMVSTHPIHHRVVDILLAMDGNGGMASPG